MFKICSQILISQNLINVCFTSSYSLHMGYYPLQTYLMHHFNSHIPNLHNVNPLFFSSAPKVRLKTGRAHGKYSCIEAFYKQLFRRNEYLFEQWEKHSWLLYAHVTSKSKWQQEWTGEKFYSFSGCRATHQRKLIRNLLETSFCVVYGILIHASWF
jgi:hypothetical protein